MAFGRLAPFPMRFGSGEPMAKMWLDEVQSWFGSAVTKENVSIMGAQNIALSRLLAAQSFTVEKLVNNSLPKYSYDLLLQWADRLGVPVRDNDTEQEIRSACEAKYMLSTGATISTVADSINVLLGNALIEVVYFYGSDLDNPPDGYWEGNPGDPQDDLGNGTWNSQRCHVLISVEQPSHMSENDLLYLLNVRLFNHLNTIMPIWCTFDWTLGEYEGFYLDVSLLDFTAL